MAKICTIKNVEGALLQRDTMVSPPIELGIPLVFNLYTNPRKNEDMVSTDSWVIGPVLKMVAKFEESTKKHPLNAMGTPGLYTPRDG
jgi:hypothetical protein